jgi:hypothetical protein
MRVPARPNPSIASAEPRDGIAVAVSVATTEHFTLQTARSTTVAEANSRASGYLATLSSTLIALAFIGNMSGLNTAFYLFSTLLLPVLAFVGIVTFGRLVQCTTEDIAYARRIAKLREFYVDVIPDLERYLTIVRGDATSELPGKGHDQPSKRQLFLTIAGMIAVVNSVVIGTACGLVASIVTSNSLVPSLAVGAPAALMSLVAHAAHQQQVLRRGKGQVVDEFAVVVPSATH